MSSVSEISRPSRRGNEPKSTSQGRQNGGSRDGTPGSQPGRKVTKPTLNENKPAENIQNSSKPLPPSPQVEHTPTIGSNAFEIDALLKKGFEEKAKLYKTEIKPSSTKSESPWGTKAGSMANGKDFWLELRRQVTALQRSGGTSQGG